MPRRPAVAGLALQAACRQPPPATATAPRSKPLCCRFHPAFSQLWYGTSATRSGGAGPLDGGISASQRRALAAARAAGRRSGSRAEARAAFPAPHLRNLVLVACHSVYTGLVRRRLRLAAWGCRVQQ